MGLEGGCEIDNDSHVGLEGGCEIDNNSHVGLEDGCEIDNNSHVGLLVEIRGAMWNWHFVRDPKLITITSNNLLFEMNESHELCEIPSWSRLKKYFGCKLLEFLV